jgi:hypothetical protein
VCQNIRFTNETVKKPSEKSGGFCLTCSKTTAIEK